MGHIEKVICVTGNYPNGQHIEAAKVVYDTPIDVSKLSIGLFQVEGRTVIDVYAEGREVIIKLDPADKAAAIIPAPEFKGPPPGGPRGPGGPKGPGGPGGPKGGMPKTERKPRKVTVTQVGDIYAMDGTVIPGNSEKMESDSAVEPVIEDFKQYTFNGLSYNLFVPKNLEPDKKYPLLVFIPDGAATGEDVLITLSQGNGAVTWAEPAWQAEHPCYILAPQLTHSFRLTNDENEVATEKFYIVKGLIDYVAYNNAVDTDRIYCTGQSGGGMCFAEMNIQYPDYFAGAMFVACQWNAMRFGAACNHKNFWILVSHDDAKAFPGWNAMTEALETNGARVGRYIWNGKSTPEEFDELVQKALEDDVNIRYTVFEGSSVVPGGTNANPATNHISTWPIAYSIKGVKEWLFRQKK